MDLMGTIGDGSTVRLLGVAAAGGGGGIWTNVNADPAPSEKEGRGEGAIGFGDWYKDGV
jgi:hypothetical protein